MTFRECSWPAALFALVLAFAACDRRTEAERAAEPIAQKNAAARGGLEAWRKVKTLSLTGTLEAGRPRDQRKLAESYLKQAQQTKADLRRAALAKPGAEEKAVQLPFVMELRRPRQSRLEVRFKGQSAVQVYDGKKGWKLRPWLGRKDAEPYSEEELRLAAQQSDLDGPLLDAAAKGNKVELEGQEPVDGHAAYRLKVTTPGGEVRRVWVDTQTYLDVRVDGTRKLDGAPRRLLTTFRDYRSVGGLLVPHLLETTVDGAPGSEKIVVERVALNPALDDARFSKPRG